MALSRPRPVLTSAGITGLVTSLAGVLVFLGYNDAAAHLSAETTTIVSVAIGAINLGSHLLAALHSQGKVTPTSDPKSAAGETLVPVTKVGEAIQEYANATAVQADTSAGVVTDGSDGFPPVDETIDESAAPLGSA